MIESIELKYTQDLQEGDILKRRDKYEFSILKSFYIDGATKKCYYYFSGYSIEEKYLNKFFEMQNRQFIIYKKRNELIIENKEEKNNGGDSSIPVFKL